MTARATKKQQALLQFVRDFLSEHDYSPSYREIMRALDYKSVSTVAAHIEGLITKGFLTRRENSARSLDVVERGSVSQEKAQSAVVKAITVKLQDDTLSDDDKTALERVKLLFTE